jgi:hypothetical protein
VRCDDDNDYPVDHDDPADDHLHDHIAYFNDTPGNHDDHRLQHDDHRARGMQPGGRLPRQPGVRHGNPQMHDTLRFRGREPLQRWLLQCSHGWLWYLRCGKR